MLRPLNASQHSEDYGHMNGHMIVTRAEAAPALRERETRGHKVCIVWL
jgi:hypothetical protein